MDKKAFANCMRKHREKQGFSLENLAEMTGISKERLIALESGEFERIKLCELEEISEVIEVPLAILLKGGGQVQALHRTESGKPYCEWVDY